MKSKNSKHLNDSRIPPVKSATNRAGSGIDSSRTTERRRRGGCSEKAIRHDILVELSKHGAFAWNAPTGVARPLGSERVVRYGLPGQPDVMAILPGGLFLGVEVKTKTGRQSREQRVWQCQCERMGGLYWIVRSVDELNKKLGEPVVRL